MNAISRTGNIFEDVAIKAPVRVATTAEIVLAGLQTIDDAVLIEGDRVLVKDQSDESENGLYAASSGTWQRTVDASKNTDFVQGTLVPVATGTANGGVIYAQQCADSPVVIGTSLITFVDQTNITGQQMAATSTTSLAIGVGAMTFATQAGKRFEANQWVLAYSSSNPSNAVLAQITSYVGTALVVNSVAIGGAGTVSDWQIVLANSPASAGRVPPVGTGNVTGPGGSVAGNLAAFNDPTGKVLKDSGMKAGTMAGRDQVLHGDVAASAVDFGAMAPGVLPLPHAAPLPTDNLILSNDVSSPNTVVDVSPGRVVSDDGATNMVLLAAQAKRLDLAWAPGGSAASPAGGTDSGSVGANQTSHVYLIGRIGTAVTSWSRTSNVVTLLCAAHGLGVGGTMRVRSVGSGLDGEYVVSAVPGANQVSFASVGADVGATVVAGFCDGFDVLLSNQAINAYPSPAMPSGWTVKQCLGSVLTDGSGNIRPFLQVVDEFRHSPSMQNSVGVSNPGTSSLRGTAVPLGLSVFARVQLQVTADTTSLDGRICSPVLSSEPAAQSNSDFFVVGGTLGFATLSQLTDSAGRLLFNFSYSTAAVSVGWRTIGWRDPRRRLF